MSLVQARVKAVRDSLDDISHIYDQHMARFNILWDLLRDLDDGIIVEEDLTERLAQIIDDAKEEDEQPCMNCAGINSCSDKCYYSPKHDPRPIKSYDECYSPMSHAYLECHSSSNCSHSISTCKYCKYHDK